MRLAEVIQRLLFSGTQRENAKPICYAMTLALHDATSKHLWLVNWDNVAYTYAVEKRMTVSGDKSAFYIVGSVLVLTSGKEIPVLETPEVLQRMTGAVESPSIQRTRAVMLKV